jgi:hypothetical protein
MAHENTTDTSFTPRQLDLLFAAWATSKDGNGIAVTDEATPDAHELAEKGWLERRVEPDGDASWWWTPAAEAALDMNALTSAYAGSVN